MAQTSHSKKTTNTSALHSSPEELQKPSQTDTANFSSSPEEMHLMHHDCSVYQIELERLSRALLATNKCNQAVIHTSDETELLQKICNIMVEVGGYQMSWVGYAENDETKSVSVVAEAGFVGDYNQHHTLSWADVPQGRGPVGISIRTGLPCAVNHILSDHHFERWRDDAKRHGFASLLALPLKTEKGTFGVLTIYSQNPDAFNAMETEFLVSLTDNLGYGITMLRSRKAKQRAENELKQSEERFRMLFEGHSAIMLVIEPETLKITDANQSAAEFYGWSIEELKRMCIDQINLDSPEIRKGNLDKFRTMPQNRFIFRHQRADSSIREVEVASNLIVIQGKELFYSIINDISERKKVEDALKESEERFRMLFAGNSAVMILVDPATGIIIDANQAAADFYGWPIVVLKQMNINQINTLTPEEITRELNKWESLNQRHFSFPHRRADGSVRDVEIFAKKIEIHGKELIYDIVHDITERKQQEEALKRSEKQFRSMFEDHSAIKLLIDPYTGKIIDANNAAADFYGWSVAELRTMLIQEINTLSAEEVIGEMEKARSTGKKQFSFRHRRADDSIRDVEVFSNVIEIEGKDRYYSIIHDITDRKQAAEEGERIKSAFLSNVSHELRSPIHGIMGLSDLLKERDVTKDQQLQYISLIHQGSERLLHLVNDLIDISRLEAGGIKLLIEETPINKLIRDLHAFFEVQTIKKGLHFYCTTGLDDHESVIESDGLRVSQILTNLIYNALKFTTSGSIHIGYTRKESMLEFYCVDSGCGIPEAMQEKIFDRFHQVDNPSIRNSEGAGLGLNIAKSLTSLLGGTIGVESEEGKGSRFFFTLPYNHPDTVLSPITQEPATAAEGITILLAEDDMVSDLLMKAILNKENITVISADNGLAAVELVANHPEINLVLMDINMPVMNGYDATCRIKQLRPELPVIGQTAYSSLEEREKAEKAGCDGFITKPINKSELLGLIQTLLHSGHQ